MTSSSPSSVRRKARSAATAAAAIQQVRTARDNAVFILYDFAYDPKLARVKKERLRFVGTFTFDKKASE